MKAKVSEMEQVIALRKKGFTYREILERVPVAKSSVSLWLMDYPLTKLEKKILKERKDKDVTRWRARAGAALSQKRIERDKALFVVAKEEFQKFVNDSFFQVGIALYWAEGSKRSTSFGFTNSDLEMTKLMLFWVYKFLTSDNSQVRFRVYTHRAFSHEHHEDWWAKMLSVERSRFGNTVYKSQSGLMVKKRPEYKGCVRIELGKVAYLRKMKYWQQMLIEYYAKQR